MMGRAILALRASLLIKKKKEKKKYKYIRTCQGTTGGPISAYWVKPSAAHAAPRAHRQVRNKSILPCTGEEVKQKEELCSVGTSRRGGLLPEGQGLPPQQPAFPALS